MLEIKLKYINPSWDGQQRLFIGNEPESGSEVSMWLPNYVHEELNNDSDILVEVRSFHYEG